METEQNLVDREQKLNTFRHLVAVLIEKEKAAGVNANFRDIEMDLNQITEEDCDMYLRIQGAAGFGEIPEMEEFQKQQKAVDSLGNQTRSILWAYFANILGPIILERDLKRFEE